MKIICKQDNLIGAFQKTSHLVGRNFNLPILNNVLIKAEDNQITFLSTNLEIGIKTIIRGKVEQEGTITAPAKILNDYINLIPADKNIELSTHDDELELFSNDWQVKIKTFSAEDYPLIPEVGTDNHFVIKTSELINGLEKVIFSASNDEARAELTGVLLRVDNNNFKLVATDSYRLAEYTLTDHKNNFSFNKQVIIPLKTAQQILYVFNDSQEKDLLNINIDENQIKFFNQGTSLVSRLVDGEYPDYKQIIPTNFNNEIEVDKNEFLKAVKAASIFSKVGIFDVELKYSNDGLEISSSNSQIGENKIKIKNLSFSGQSDKIFFNYKYLIDGLNNLSGNKIRIFINSPKNPVVFKGLNNEDYVYLVMPIKQ